MNTTQPIRDKQELENFKNYYLTVKPNPRNVLLIIIGLNTALRISDILNLCWGSVYDLEHRHMRKHISMMEQKTGKKTRIYINQTLKMALLSYMNYLHRKGIFVLAEDFLFYGQKNKQMPISRVQAFRIIKEAAHYCNIKETISCHSLRKTFGYHAWKQGIPPALLMNIYNHSSYQITKRYLCIEQDDKDEVFQNIVL